jgi:hypothetical protein
VNEISSLAIIKQLCKTNVPSCFTQHNMTIFIKDSHYIRVRVGGDANDFSFGELKVGHIT